MQVVVGNHCWQRFTFSVVYISHRLTFWEFLEYAILYLVILKYSEGAQTMPASRMWPVSRKVSNQVLQAVPTSSVPNVWREGGTNGVPVLVCLAARHFSLSNQAVRHEWDPCSCLFLVSSLSYVTLPWKTLRAHIFPLHSIESPRHRYTYLETITMEQMVQSVPCFVSVCCCSPTLCVLFFFFFFYVPRPNHRLNEHALLCFQAFLQKGECVSQECEKGKKKKKEAVCLCVALLDMTRDDIMGDAAAAAAGRWGRIPFVSCSLRVMCLSVTLHKTGHWCSSK